MRFQAYRDSTSTRPRPPMARLSPSVIAISRFRWTAIDEDSGSHRSSGAGRLHVDVAGTGREHGEPPGHGLEERHGDPLAERGEHEDVGRGEDRGLVGTVERSGEDDVGIDPQRAHAPLDLAA